MLLVTLALTGGVDRYVRERCDALLAQGWHPIVLAPSAAASPDEAVRRRVDQHAHSVTLWSQLEPIEGLNYRVPQDLPALVRSLRALDLQQIEITHFLGIDTRVIDAVRSLPAGYRVSLHDYAWLCPRLFLVDASRSYCGEPALRDCEACLQRLGSAIPGVVSVRALRARSRAVLRGAAGVTAPSRDCAERYRAHLPGLTIGVRAYREEADSAAPGLDADAAVAASLRDVQRLTAGRTRPLRVALLGMLNTHKGYARVLACARAAAKAGLPMEFTLVGFSDDDARLTQTGLVKILGAYPEGELPARLAAVQADVVWLASVWPETWCYTLDAALDSRLPVVSFDIGAQSERLRRAGRGILLPLSSPVSQVLAALWRAAPVPSLRPVVPRSISLAMKKSAAPVPAKPDGLAASVQVLPVEGGLYLFGVRRGPAPAQGGTSLTVPALQVSLGPGTPPDRVQFVSGLSGHGAWLFSTGDQLVARVGAPGATLVLTSIQAPNGDSLDVAVERLDRREGAGAAATAMAAAPAAAETVPAKDPAAVSVQITAHIRTAGDRRFLDADWAGRAGKGLWIESFGIEARSQLRADDIEYKGLTANGFETPWTSMGRMCGTRGMAVPLVGFAVRLKGDLAARYDCQYSGAFQSGTVIGPLRNGLPCRSSLANDPLEGIQVKIGLRQGVSAGRVAVPAAAPAAVKPAVAVRKPAAKKAVKASAVKAVSGKRAVKAAVRKPAKAAKRAQR